MIGHYEFSAILTEIYDIFCFTINDKFCLYFVNYLFEQDFRHYLSKEDSNQATSYIHFWDWGPKSGANWVVTNKPNDGTSQGIESANVEYGVVTELFV